VTATRRQLLVGAAAALVAAPAAAPAAAGAAPTGDDRRKAAETALTQALEIEQTCVVAYEAIANSGRMSVRGTALMRSLLDDDRQHAAQLVTALEAQGVQPPIPPRRATIRGLNAVHDDRGAAGFAIALEERAVGAYSEAVRNLSDANLLRTVAGAMGTDGQHLVVLRLLAGRDPVPGAFERGIHP
jgi:predicted outer membrane protein